LVSQSVSQSVSQFELNDGTVERKTDKKQAQGRVMIHSLVETDD